MSKPNDRIILKRQQYDPITPRTSKKPNVSTTPNDVIMDMEETVNIMDQVLNNLTMPPDELRQIIEKAKTSCAVSKAKLGYTPQRSHNVDCTECKRAITGRLFTCLECDAYHLCHECERARLHVEHPMLRLGNPDTPRVVRTKGKTEPCTDLNAVEQLIEAKFEQVVERIAEVEETIKDHQVISNYKRLPAPNALRSERVKRQRTEGQTPRKPKRIPYPLPTSWTETLHETQKKAKTLAMQKRRKR